MFECSEEMYEAFKKSLTEASDSETQRDVYMNAIEASVADHITRLQTEVERLKEQNGELDQSRSDNSFYMSKLRTRAFEALGMDPDSSTWFEVVDRLEILQPELTKARELSQEVDDFLYLLNGHDSYARIPHKYGKPCHEVIDDLRAKLCAFLTSQLTAPAAKVRQYYYRTNNCKAPDSKDPACDCWHDEGTGPLGNKEDNRKWGVSPSSWRDKPAAKDGE